MQSKSVEGTFTRDHPVSSGGNSNLAVSVTVSTACVSRPGWPVTAFSITAAPVAAATASFAFAARAFKFSIPLAPVAGRAFVSAVGVSADTSDFAATTSFAFAARAFKFSIPMAPVAGRALDISDSDLRREATVCLARFARIPRF